MKTLNRMNQNIFSLIKSRRAIRIYESKLVPKWVLKKIIDAGRWGPSLTGAGFQPWKFIVIRNKAVIDSISNILLEKSKTIGVGLNAILRISAFAIKNSPVIIVVYNDSSLVKFAKRLKKRGIKIAEFAEICSISAAIQNMILVAHDLGVGSCWLDAPLFCQRKINKFLNIEDSNLVSILTLGYPAMIGRRARRKQISETVQYRD